MPFSYQKGCVYYCDDKISKMSQEYLSFFSDNDLITCNKKYANPIHITILDSKETNLININFNELNKIDVNIYDFGIGKIENENNYCYYIFYIHQHLIS